MSSNSRVTEYNQLTINPSHLTLNWHDPIWALYPHHPTWSIHTPEPRQHKLPQPLLTSSPPLKFYKWKGMEERRKKQCLMRKGFTTLTATSWGSNSDPEFCFKRVNYCKRTKFPSDRRPFSPQKPATHKGKERTIIHIHTQSSAWGRKQREFQTPLLHSGPWITTKKTFDRINAFPLCSY